MLEDVLKTVMYLIGIYVFIHVLLFIINFFKELFEETWQLWVGYGALIVVIFGLRQLYVFNNFFGVTATILVLCLLLYLLHKKIGIIKFLKIFTGIDEYNKEDTFWKKLFKILRITFTIIIFSSITLGAFTIIYEAIFLGAS